MVFRLGDRSYGIDLGAVREILRPRPATRLPGAPAAVLGLVNVRGRIVTVVDLATTLGLRASPAPGAVMLVEHGPKLVGAAVDEVLDVQRWSEDGMDAAPQEVQAGGAVRAIGTHEGGVVVVLDIHDLLSHVLA
ncbi:MAG TPA: chemotaxis protein CheW [Dongiaceae bacterium]|nr:chemotaxis protein CheW [Dongiaceae bacterium]